MAGNDFVSYIEGFVDILKDGSGKLVPLFIKGKLLMAFEEMIYGFPTILRASGSYDFGA